MGCRRTPSKLFPFRSDTHSDQRRSLKRLLRRQLAHVILCGSSLSLDRAFQIKLEGPEEKAALPVLRKGRGFLSAALGRAARWPGCFYNAELHVLTPFLASDWIKNP
jgi:hypothetical protein